MLATDSVPAVVRSDRLRGKVAIVTGAGRGLGAAQARALAAHGALVVRTTRSASAPEGPGKHWRLDVRRSAEWSAVVESVVDQFGRIDVLVNNAGVVHQEPMESASEDNFREAFEVNQLGTWLGMRAVIPGMRRAGGGSIVNISSAAGLIAVPDQMGYIATKWAIRGMTKAAALELAVDGIRVNSVHPGVIDTDMSSDGHADGFVLDQPIKRMGTPDEVAHMVVFLASDESAFSTGSEFVLDGGYSAT